MRAAPGDAHENIFQGHSAGSPLEGGKRVAGEEAPGVDNCDTVGEQFDLWQSVGGEEQGSIAAAKHLGFEEAAKFGSGDSVQAARRFIKEEDAWLMQQGAGEAQSLHRAGRKGADLAVKRFFEMELFREQRDALRSGGVRKMVEAAEEPQILATGKPRVKAEVATGMVAELAANGARVENGIVSRDLRMAPRGKEQRGKNLEKRGFACAICSQQRQSFTGTHFEGNSGERDNGRLFKRLQEGAPAAACGGKRLLQGCNVNRGFRHDETYSVSAILRQSAGGKGNGR